jgi:hypothetical protein
VSGLAAAAAALVGELPAVDLATLEADAELAVRTDRKHLLGWEEVARLLQLLTPTHAALEIGGRRAFAYDTTYFDTDDLHCFRAHVQGRRRRYKCRTRLYADTDVCALEVKLRGGAGDRTVKLRRPVGARDHGCLDADGRAFLSDCLGPVPPMAPSLRGHHTRVTLVGAGERCTLDFDLAYVGGGALAPGLVIVESKSERGRGTADRALLALRNRPVSCSKYCLGIALQRRGAAPIEIRPLMRMCTAA